MSSCLCEINYSQLLQRFHLSGTRYTLGMTAEVTHRCNFGCRHCYCCINVDSQSREQELSLEEWDRILSECADMGVLFITMTGGEPLLYENFRELWIDAKRKGFLVNLFTNAVLIDSDWADFFAEWTPALVSVTLYGASNDTYTRVTGVEGAFDRVLTALELMRERQLKLEVKGTFSRLNKNEFHEIRNIALKYCDMFRWATDLVGCYENGGSVPEAVRLSPEEIVELEMSDPVRREELLKRANCWKPMKKSLDSPFRCGVGKALLHIDPYGQLHPCLLFDSIRYDLRSGSVQDGWYRELPEMLKSIPWGPGPCQSCDLADICMNCTAKSLLSNAPLTGPSDFYCSYGYERAKAMQLLEKVSDVPQCLQKKMYNHIRENLHE